MPVFEYKALNPKGKKVSGIIDAEGVVAARQKLRGSGIYPISVSEVVKASVKRDIGKFSIGNLFTRVRPAEVAMMTRQLATLVGAGFPLVSAIDSLIPQTKSQTFRKILAHIKESVVEGNTFADSLSPYPGIFSSLYVNMVHASETSGTL
ncbi:MAG: type II secretion system F family protein, partial [Deltaproteobacteria bacterium]|nr:type II secretion system F family protein [Deltaproteobacteria bacterium]